MSEIITNIDGERPAKKQKLIRKVKEPAQIFKLNIDCFLEILEYLSAKQLLALSQTCKLMQQVVGEYVRANYSAASKIDENDCVSRVFFSDETKRSQLLGFNQFIRNISFYIQPFKASDHEFTSLNHLNLIHVDMNLKNINCIQKLLNKLEIIQIKHCPFQGDFYENFLQFCTKLKRLHITSNLEDIIKSNDNKWLHKTHSTLEHLELYPKQRLRFDLNELIHFFELNNNVRSFSTSYRFVWEHQVEFIESKIQLDEFEVKIFREFGNEWFIVQHMESMFDILNQLYDRGFYKRLHLHLPNVTEECTNQMISLQGLEKLSIGTLKQWYNLHRLIQLKELAITHTPPVYKMDILAQALVNLELLFICHANYGDILPFIRYCPKLTKIIMKDERETGGSLMNISILNHVRKQLKNAHKVTIFVSDDLYVASKYADNGQTFTKFIRIQRSDSYRWKQYYY